ncbi:hypothetical protein ES319_A03G216100v1 [Gossypium barbadense]|uniref:Uncharacterized protein n=2 Tax=Gossypium TaxID=3633 RepID=A0A5J5WIK2_GOSBA|nr:hypothetical protein ES319_A03G216100v1 [Gossypium barbadense]TYH26323.1 hypothetical protein ES288_A03G242300v1 [Gossypium darwinii]
MSYMLQLVPRLLVMLCCNQIVPRGRKTTLNLTADEISEMNLFPFHIFLGM